MAEHSFAACVKAIRKQLTATNTEAWGQQVWLGQAQENVAFPYVLIDHVPSGEANESRDPDARYLFLVRAVSDDGDESLTCAGRISALLNDTGIYDISLRPTDANGLKLDAGPDWYIGTSTQDLAFHHIDNVQGARPLYSHGARYEFKMGRV